MTIEEAIARHSRVRYNLLSSEDKEAVDIVFDALRAQQEAKQKSPCTLCGYGGKHLDAPPCTRCPAHPKEAEKNDPLTLDELREMAQKCEGVYVAHVDGSPVFRGQRYCAATLDFSPAFGSTVLHVHAIYGDRLTLWEDEYGKTWLAYRRKPEEGMI